MGKVRSLINATPDGFVDSQYVNADAEFHEFVHGLLEVTQQVAFGRNSFELFQGIWPAILEKENAAESQLRMARTLTDLPKQAYSTTLNTTSWKNTTIVRALDSDTINAFKKEGERGLLTIGSPGLVAALTRLHLIDDYYFCMQPVIAGNGNVRLFDKMRLDTLQPLQLVDSRTLKSGVVILHYQQR